MIAAPRWTARRLLLDSLHAVPGQRTVVRFPLQHDEAQIGLLESRGGLAGPRAWKFWG